MPDGARVTFRATNSFGGIVPGYAIIDGVTITSSFDDGFRPMWAKRCAGRAGTDETYIRRALP